MGERKAVCRITGGGVVGLRLMLLPLLVFGVLQMHIFGHPSGEHAAHGAASAAAHTVLTTEAVSTVEAAEPTGPVLSLDPLMMCLAVLTAFAAAAFIVLWLRLAVSRVPGGGAPLPMAFSWRSPPSHVPALSRRLAGLSVLRI